jgi:hypothetical protein
MSSTSNQKSEPPASSDVVEPATARPVGGTINIRNISVKCGNCNTYQTLASFSRRDEWNVYTYECENDTCDPNVTRTLVEVPQDLDEFANRDPDWRGGKKWGGAED